MSYTGYAGVRTWDGSEAVSIHGATTALGASIDGSLCPSFANVAARNAAAAALITAGRVGMMCYCVAEDGHCVYRGATRGWKWLPYYELVSDQYWSGPALVSGPWPTNAGIGLLGSGSIVLPGNGLRRIHVNAKASVQGWDSAPMSAGMQLTGTGAGGGAIMASIPALGDFSRVSLTQEWNFTASGTQTWTLWGYVFGSAAVAQFLEIQLQVIEQGPA